VVLIERRDEKFADPPHRCAEGGEIEEVKARRALPKPKETEQSPRLKSSVS
jgi:hypothetical protein